VLFSGYPKLLDGLNPYGSKNVIGFGNAKTHQRTIKKAKESCKTPCVRVFLEWLAKGNEETTTIPIAASLAKTRVLYDYDGLVDELQCPELSPELMAAIEKSVEEKLGKTTQNINQYAGYGAYAYSAPGTYATPGTYAAPGRHHHGQQ
jgi:hypothetical protein